MENPYIGLLPPASVSVTVAATRRRDRRSSRPREYLTAREIEKLMDAAREQPVGLPGAVATACLSRLGAEAVTIAVKGRRTHNNNK
jgi:hypothetical protein